MANDGMGERAVWRSVLTVCRDGRYIFMGIRKEKKTLVPGIAALVHTLPKPDKLTHAANAAVDNKKHRFKCGV